MVWICEVMRWVELVVSRQLLLQEQLFDLKQAALLEPVAVKAVYCTHTLVTIEKYMVFP